MKYTIKLNEYPPSVNSAYYFLRMGKRTIKVKNAKAKAFMAKVRQFKPPKPFQFDVKVTVYMYITDRRKHDLDNINKVLLDSLKKDKQGHYFMEDDDMITEIHMYKIREKYPKYKLIVVLEDVEKVRTLDDYN